MAEVLQGRVALVTGGLRGIGEAAVARLISAGARVIVTDIEAADADATKTAMAEFGERATYRRLDVASESDWSAVVAAVKDDEGRLDVLINNAGVDCVGAVEDITHEAWRRIMSINVDGVFYGVKHCTPLLAETGADTPAGSSVVNVSSIMGIVGYSETSAYNASKGAVRLFTKATAVEFAQKQYPIRVNSVHPGFVQTPLLNQGMQRWVDQGMAPTVEALVSQLGEATPIGRVAAPEEIAAAIFFLASDDSSYCTGSELVVDGGWTAR